MNPSNRRTALFILHSAGCRLRSEHTILFIPLRKPGMGAPINDSS